MICDEVKPNCLVIACCSERCVEVNNVIEDNQRMVKTSHEYAYGNMRKNEYCPVCHTQLFSYSISDRFENEVKPSKVFLHCIYCHSNYELIRTKDDWLIYSHLMIDHGRAICKARTPDCKNCFLKSLCPSANI